MSAESQNIQVLLDRYKSSMPEKADIVSKHIDMLLDDEDISQENVQEIRENLHKLAGSSGMYGYQDIANITREAMQMIDECNANMLHQHLLSIRNLLRQHAKS